MKYYILTNNATMLLRVAAPNSGEFIVKRGYEKDADAVKLELDVRATNNPDVDVYAPTMIRKRFPNTIEVDSAKFEDAIKKVEQFNAEYDDNVAELEAMSLEDLKTYISTAPARMPKLINYAQINKLWQVLYSTSESGFMSIEEGERNDDEVKEDIHALYTIIKDAEITNDNTMIKNVLKLGENITPEALGISFVEEPTDNG